MYFTDKKYKQIEPHNMMPKEFFQIAKKLEEFNSVFSSLWKMGIPVIADTYGIRAVNTAEVHFDSENRAIKIYINPHLWERLSWNQKIFILCHECLHVVFNYGFRALALDDKNNANVAADVAINQILINNFMFLRKEIDPDNELCWQDSGLMKIIPNVESMQTMEYYYNLLCTEGDAGGSGEDGEGKDKENGLPFFIGNHNNVDKEDGKDIEDLCRKLNETLSEEEKQSIQEMIEQHFREEENYDYKDHKAGNSAGNIWFFIEKTVIKPKKKWETVIKKWANLQIKEERREIEQWISLNRRFILLPRNLIIPSEMEFDTTNHEKKKIKVWFFQDTSGSCAGYRKRFFTAAESLPTKRFDVKMHCFDTKVYETTLQSRKLYGFGGTRFDIIEDYILKNMKEYPKAIFVITDGAGNKVNPKHPDRWYIFLTQNTRYCFPNECNFFDLNKFE